MKLSLLAVMILIFAESAPAQSSTDESQLLGAAARYVASTLLPRKTLALDTTRSHIHVPQAIAQTRANDMIAARELGTAKIGTQRDFLKCQSGPGSCVFDGVDAIVAFGPLKITGDSAMVRIQITERFASPKQPFVRTGGAARFVRRAGGWAFLSYGRASTS